MMRRIFILLGFLSVVSASASAQEGIVRGKVFDKVSGESLPGVYVIYGKNLGTTTDQNGLYSIAASSGKLSITFQLIGYESVNRDITLNREETTLLDVGLTMKVREIDQIVVSANKKEQRVAELSVSMDIIKSDFLSGNHITDAQELINKTPGIEVLDGQASIRGGSGFSYGTGSRVLALIDGLPMLSADAGNIKWQFLPLENLSQVEIIKGASSVLYGSSALNGVINFITADASNIPETHFYAEAGIYGAPENKNWIWWDTPRLFTSASFSHLQRFGKTDLGISANLLNDEGYRRLSPEKLGRLSLKVKHFNSKIDGLTYGININSGYTVKRDFLLWEDADSGALKQQESATVEVHGTFLAIDPFITLRKSGISRQDLRMRFQTSINHFPESAKTNSNAYSLYTEYQFWHKITRFMDLTAGLVENYNLVNSNFFDDHKSLNLAGYAQFEIRPLDRLKAVAGVRLEQNSLDGKNDKLVPVFRAGLNWQAAEYTYLRASFGQGYRFPSIAEKFASTTLGSISIIPSPDIMPESGLSAETGVKQGIMIGKLTGQVDLSAFIAQNTNMIEYYLANYEGITGFKGTNVEQSRIIGNELEINMSGTIGKVSTSLSGGYTFIYPVELDRYTNRSNGKYLKYRRKQSGKISITASWKKFSSELNVYARSKILRIDEFFLDEATGGAMLPGFPTYWNNDNKGYAVLDWTMGYNFNEKYNISLTVKNLTNTEYMGRPGDIQPQRNYSLRFSGNF
jgi:outer membrane receptor protein involved in Fe transport